MAALPPILLAGLTGCISGLVSAIPVGPVNLALMNEGARRGFKRAAFIGLGAVCMEAAYCFIAFSGLAAFLTNGHVRTAMELFTFIFIFCLGLKFLLAKSPDVAAPLGVTVNKIEKRIEERLHPRSAFMIGFVRVLGNLGVLVFWVVLAAHFMAREWVTPDWPGKLACVTGVALGLSVCFFALSYAASRGHGKFSDRTLLRLEHWSGVGLLVLALAQGGHLVWQIARHRW